MGKKVVIIQGSSRSKGDTYAFIIDFLRGTSISHIDLKNYKIAHYDYEANYEGDDFLSLIESLIRQYDTFIFATPIYWYTMSGIMKVFFDRFSDLLQIHKPLGRQLRGKSMSVMSISSSDDVEAFFYRPFELSAEYLGMQYLGHVHAYGDSNSISKETKERLQNFKKLNLLSNNPA